MPVGKSKYPVLVLAWSLTASGVEAPPLPPPPISTHAPPAYTFKSPVSEFNQKAPSVGLAGAVAETVADPPKPAQLVPLYVSTILNVLL